MSEALPREMTAIEITAPGGPEVLKPARRKVPAPGEGEVLIRVAAAGVNYPDVMQRQGRYPPPAGASDIPGLEVAGEIVALGAGVAGRALGEAVCALVTGGGYAEYCAAPAPQCLPVPKGLGPVEAAALPETFFTVWTNLVDRGRLAAGEAVLVHGGAGGIGTAAVQIAHALGARVFATAGSDEKCRLCEELGAERGINYRTEDFVAAVKEATGGAGVALVLDIVGGAYFERNLEALAPEGRLVQIAVLQGAKVSLFLPTLMQKRLTLTGSTLRPRSVADKGAIAAALAERVWPLIEAGRIKPLVHRTFPLAAAAEAHALIEAGGHVGKLVLTV